MKHIRFSLLALCVILLFTGVACDSTPPNPVESNPDETTEENSTMEDINNSGSFYITKDGTQYVKTIVMPNDAPATVVTAANDLKKYLRQITGCNFTVAKEDRIEGDSHYIFVGKTKKAAEVGIEAPSGYPGEEKSFVVQKDGHLFLLGNDDGNYTGTEFAVTMFLESLGCGWFGEDTLWHIIPSLETIDATNVNMEHKARFTHRENRIVSSGCAIAKRWYLGGEKTITGHWLFQICPESTYKTKPEWFALVNGSRDPSRFPNYTYQYCYSNTEFSDFVAKKLIEYFDSHPVTTSMTISFNDAWDQGYCECDTCKALGNASDCMVHFANNVARIVGKTYPERTMQIYSYHKTYQPPQNKVALEPNVELMLCRETSMTRPLDQKYVSPNPKKDSITKNTYTKSWYDNAMEWIDKTSCKNVSIWEWYCIAADRAEWKDYIWVQGNVATRNLDLWESMGVKYVFYDQGPADGYHEDNSSFVIRWPLWYVAAMGEWGTDKTGEELLADACDKLFGNASSQMFAFYQMLAEASENCSSYSMTWVPPTIKEMYKSRQPKLNTIVASIRSAMKNCTDKEKERINQTLKYWQIMSAAL